MRLIHKLSVVAMLTCAAALAANAADLFPVFHKDSTVLFQGDSITDGGRQRTGSDYNHIMGQDYAYIISAAVGSDIPERNVTFINRGISGNTIIDIAARWQADTLDLKPDFLSILDGINDLEVGVPKGETVEQFEHTYDTLLSQTIAALPGVKIVLGEPFMLPVGKRLADYNLRRAELKKYQEAVDRLGSKYQLPVVHYQDALDQACKKAPATHWSWDGIHPTYAGHGLMAKEWLATVNRFWPNR